MSQQNQKTNSPKKRIADEIMHQIGRSVLLVFLVVAVAATCMAAWIIVTSKETELTLKSQSAANQLTGFLDQYIKSVEQLSVNPEIVDVLTETTAGDDILQAEKMNTVMTNLVSIANTDPNNVMAVWISDLDASVLTQSDGFTSAEGWDITTREWYKCIQNRETILTEPYVDSSTGKIILSAASPVFDGSSSTVIGAAGMDIALEHMTEIMSNYKIGNGGHVLLLSGNGVFLYHPDNSILQKNIADIDISKNAIDAVRNC